MITPADIFERDLSRPQRRLFRRHMQNRHSTVEIKPGTQNLEIKFRGKPRASCPACAYESQLLQGKQALSLMGLIFAR